MNELYELPEGWEWKKLDDCTDLITKGTTPTTYGYEFLDKGINFLKIENIIKGKIDLNSINKFISEEANQSQKRSILKHNDVLFSIAGTIGDTAIVKEEHLPMNTNQAIAIIRPTELLNPVFLQHSLLSIVSERTKKKQRGGAIKNISLTDIKNIEIPLPPLQEQKRIVAKLDSLFAKIDQAIALHQQNMDETDAWMGSVLNEVFGELEEKYEKDIIKNISKVGTGVTPLKSKTEYYENGCINWITSKATNNNFIVESEQMISEIAVNECRLKINPVGTLIVALYGQGKTRGQVSELKIESATNQAIATIIVNEDKVFNRYLKYFLKKSYLDLRKKASGGTQANLNLTIIKNIELPLPPLIIQQKTVQYLDQLSQKTEILKQVQNDEMESLKALKASILDRAFRGEL